jgi:hypothetical protein
VFLRPVKEILCIFGEASGLMVNYRTTTATIIRGQSEEEDRVRVTEILG